MDSNTAKDVVGDVRSKSDIAKAANEAKSLMAVATAFVAQPFIVSRTLMQIGYEPVAPVIGVSLFTRTSGYYYPNTYQYVWNLKNLEGFTSIFTGVTAKVLNIFVSRATEETVDRTIRKVVPCSVDADKPAHKKGISASVYEVIVECVSKSAAVVISQPLHVVMVRMICSLVNKDKAYQGFFSSFKEIYNTEGLSGFFTGLLPRWFSEIATVAMTGTIMYGVYRVIENTIEDENVSSSPNYQALVQFYVYGLVYKYQLTSTVMAASCKGLNVGLPVYSGWRACFTHLQLHNQLKRGQSMFYREAII